MFSSAWVQPWPKVSWNPDSSGKRILFLALEAIALRLEAITSRLEAIDMRLSFSSLFSLCSLRVGVLGRAHTSSKPLENTVNTVQSFKNCSEN